MKKIVIALLLLSLILCSSVALAAGKVSVTQENFYTIHEYSDYAYVFARIDNVGNKPVKVNAGILEVYDNTGDNITSTDSFRCSAQYLEPDEYTYGYLTASLEDGQFELVDDYLLTVTGKSDNSYSDVRLSISDASFQRDVKVSRYSTYDYAYFTITNNTNEDVWDVDIVYALLDENDEILYVGRDSISSNMAITPGSSMKVRESISSSWMDYYDANNITPAKVDAIAYVQISND